MKEKTKDQMNDFLKVLESKFPDLFIVFEEKVIKLFQIVNYLSTHWKAWLMKNKLGSTMR